MMVFGASVPMAISRRLNAPQSVASVAKIKRGYGNFSFMVNFRYAIVMSSNVYFPFGKLGQI